MEVSFLAAINAELAFYPLTVSWLHLKCVDPLPSLEYRRWTQTGSSILVHLLQHELFVILEHLHMSCVSPYLVLELECKT